MNIDEAFASKYLKASDAQPGDLTLTIADVQIQTVGSGQDAKSKPVVFFEEDDRGLALNMVNKDTIVGMYGSDTDGWIGRKLVLFAANDKFGGKPIKALRVRNRPPQRRAQPQQAATHRNVMTQDEVDEEVNAPLERIPPNRTQGRRAVGPEPRPEDADIPFHNPFVDDYEALP